MTEPVQPCGLRGPRVQRRLARGASGGTFFMIDLDDFKAGERHARASRGRPRHRGVRRCAAPTFSRSDALRWAHGRRRVRRVRRHARSLSRRPRRSARTLVERMGIGVASDGRVEAGVLRRPRASVARDQTFFDLYHAADKALCMPASDNGQGCYSWSSPSA